MSRVEHKDPIIEQLRKVRKDRKVSVVELSDILDVPADRIYKWDQGKAAPKFEDRKKVEKWISGKLEESVPRAPDLQSKSKTNEEQTNAGTVPASKLIEVLEEQNAFLRRNFETSLTTILEVQQQAGNQLGALTWYSALVANGRDEKKAAADLSEIHNNIASFEEVGSGDDNSQTNNNKRTSAKRKVRK